MNERDALIDYISDAHKDAYGFRPRNIKFYDKSIDELKALADKMSVAVCRSSKKKNDRTEPISNSRT